MDPPSDPYHLWLGIPPAEQPPNHYQLLRVRPFEDNLLVIENAVKRTTAYLRNLQSGPHRALAERIQGEVATAAACLLDPAQKVSYDRALYSQMIVQPRSPWPPVTAQDISQPVPPPASLAIPPAPAPRVLPHRETQPRTHAPAHASSQRESTRRPIVLEHLKIILGGIAGLAIGYYVIFLVTGKDLLRILPRRATPPAQAVVVAPLPNEAAPDLHATEPVAASPPPETAPSATAGLPSSAPPLANSPSSLPTGRAAPPAEPPLAEAPRSTSAAPLPPVKHPVPSQSEQQNMLVQIKSIYKVEFDKAIRPDARPQLVSFLHATAKELDADPVAQYVMYRAAYDQAVALQDFATAEEIINDLDRRFEIDAARARARLSEARQSAAKTKPAAARP